MLNAYLLQTRSLLQLPGTDSTSLYTDADLTRWINTARGQLAGEAECIRVMGTVPTVVGQRPYSFSAINVGVPATTGVQAVMNVRSIRYSVPGADGSLWVPGRPWEWFNLYELNNATPPSGPPETWSQFGQGAAPGIGTGSGATGSFYVSPLPDIAYTLNCDCVCYPIPLTVDGTVEAIPYLFTDCVPFFAAYYALLSPQMGARYNDAIQMYKMYAEFMSRARKAVNATPNRWQFEQAADPAQAAKMGVKPGAAA